MKERQKDPLHNAIRELPEYSPRPDTWDTIAQSLAADEQLSKAIARMPERAPRADTWDQIATALTTERRRTITRAWWTAAAAALVLWVGISLWWEYRQSPTDVVFTYREESVSRYEAEKVDTNDTLEEEALAYIEQICQKAPPATCQRPEFQELRAHLTELSQEERELQKTIEQLGYDPQLVKYQIRIENMKADATRELIRMVTG